jgi:hypothetical protein
MIRKRFTAVILPAVLMVSIGMASGCKKRVATVPGTTAQAVDMQAVADQADRAINLVAAAEDGLAALGRAKLISPQAEIRGHEIIIKLSRGIKSFSQRARTYVNNPDPLGRSTLALLLTDLVGFIGDLNATAALGVTDVQARARLQAALDIIAVSINSVKGLLGA